MKFIYFDVCEVLIKDFGDNESEWEKFLDSLGLINRKNEFNKFWGCFSEKLMVGENPQNFSLIMESKFGINLPKNYSISDEIVNRFFDKNEGIWKTVEKVKVRYKIGLLTNMYKGMLGLINEKKLMPKMVWDVVIDSSVERYQKPERRIYEIAEEKSGFKEDEILFIDNRKENLEIPKEMGWQTFWFDSSNYERSNKELGSFLR